MPSKGFRTVSIREEVYLDIEQAISEGRLKKFAIHRVGPAVELAARRLIDDVKPAS